MKFTADPVTGCWLWHGAIDSHGYGQVNVYLGVRDEKKRSTTARAHRRSYEHHKGPIQEGLELDHLCRRRNCINPAHLEPVTTRENGLRGDTIQSRYAVRTHCNHGHEFTPENIYRDNRGYRRCRQCILQRERSTKRKRHRPGRNNWKREKQT